MPLLAQLLPLHGLPQPTRPRLRRPRAGCVASSRPGGGLILPGSANFPADGPSQQRPSGFGPSSVPRPDGPLYQPFRPPPVYRDTAVQGKEELMRKIVSRSGRWFELAKVLDTLHASGVQNTEIFEATGISQLDQNSWKVQAVVYYSLEALPDFPKEALAFFAGESGAATLAELKIVSAAWRPKAARFVAERALDVLGARELARSIVDVERKREPGASFEETPGDALAAKIWRDAGEVPRRGGWRDAVRSIVERGLSVATGERAKAKLRERLEAAVGEGPAADAPPARAQVQIVRLESEEAAYRPVPLLGPLEDLSAEKLAAAPRCVTEGVFNAFRPAGGLWVALPAWAKLAQMEQLAAISVADTRSLRSVPSLAAFPGPCLLLVERAGAGGAGAAQPPPRPDSFYLVQRASSLLLDSRGGRAMARLEIAAGAEVTAGGGGVTLLGRLVLACRPPLPAGTPGELKLPPGMKDLGDALSEEDDAHTQPPATEEDE